MHPENGAEGPVLEPAHEQLPVGRIIRVPDVESADIGCPVRNSGKGEIQPGRDLALEGLEIGRNVARPGGRAVALNAGKGRAGKNEDPFPVRLVPLPLVHAGGMHEREDVGIPRAAADGGLIAREDVLFASRRLGLGGVEPPGIRADLEKGVVHQAPILGAGFRVHGIVERHAGRMNVPATTLRSRKNPRLSMSS